MTEYTPTTEQAREWYENVRYDDGAGTSLDTGPEFDRWLTSHDREIAARAIEGLAAKGINYSPATLLAVAKLVREGSPNE